MTRLRRLSSTLVGAADTRQLEALLGPGCAAALGARQGRLVVGDAIADARGDLILPLRIAGTVTAVIALDWDGGHGPEDDEGAVAAMAADLCASAFERSRLQDQVRAAEAHASQAEQRSSFLAEASIALSESLDYPTTLSRVAHLVVPRVADWCAISVLDRDDRMRRVAVVHHDPQKQALAEAYLKGHGPEEHRPTIMLREMLGGRSILLSTVADELLTAVAQNPAHVELLRGLGVSSALIVPLMVRGKALGAISMMQSDSARRFTEHDVALGEDLARRAAIAIDNARLYGEAQKANESKDRFLAMLGHELRNPLAPIVTALELMRLRGSADTIKERAVIERQVQHLGRLVDDLLDISRITRGKIELRRVPTELAAVAAKAVEMVSPLLEQRRHHLELDVPSQGLVVDVDEARLAQVIANLLSNAAKYTEPGGRIALSAAREGSNVVVRVRDNGAGLSSDLLPRVFDPFVQGARGTDRALGGLGLGLTLVRSLVMLHGGTVSAASAGPGQGSEFTVRLPTAPLTQPEGSLARRRLGRPPAAQEVLVVDDNPDAAEMLAEFLREEGHRVEVAPDGPTALRLAAKMRPTVAILDIGLPVMDGYELAQLLRSQLGADSPRLIALTGYGQEKDRVRSAEAGFAMHLVKPVEPSKLLEAIAAVPS